MVVVQCYHCSKILELDEGFRGGVCRCSQCGSLLQVPKASAAGSPPKARPAAPGAKVATGRPGSPTDDTGLSRGPMDPRSGIGSGMSGVGSGSGIGSGIGSGQARPQRPRGAGEAGGAIGSGAFARSPMQPTGGGGSRKIERVKPVDGEPAGAGMASAAAQARKTKKMGAIILFVGIGVVALIFVIGLWAILAFMGDEPVKPTTGRSGGGGQIVDPGGGMVEQPPAPKVLPEGFYGTKLTGKRVVISIDSGGSMKDVYDYVTKAIRPIVMQLDAGQELKVVVWQSPTVVVPGNDWIRKGEVAKLKEFENTFSSASGQDALSNMVASVKLGADQTIFITAKIDFPPTLADAVLKARTPAQKIDTLWISSSQEEPPLKKIAQGSGGSFRMISPADDLIKAYAK